MTRIARTTALAACILLAPSLLLGGCAGATPYHAADLRASEEPDGYHEVAIERGRWRVVFRGNTLTSRETVETYLLYRAAELTREQGYDWFVSVTRDTELHVDTFSAPPPGTLNAGWSPRWRVATGAGWRTWNGDPLGSGFERSTVTAYEAIAEIRMGSGDAPASDPRAYDARDVLATLQTRIVRPEAGQ